MKKFDTKVTLATIKNDMNKSDSAIREAVANAIDAKSKNIYLCLYEEEATAGLMKVKYFSLDIADDGDGIPSSEEDFEKVFCQYKVSTKKEKSNYGRRGKGRYTYLTLVTDSDNVSIYTRSKKENFKINFECKDNENITIIHNKYSDKIQTPLSSSYTTLIQFKDLDSNKFNIDKKNKDEYIDDIKNEIITYFADRIASESVNIYVNGTLLKISDFLEEGIISKEIKIEENEDEIVFKVDFYIWNEKVKLKADRQKHILFLDAQSMLKGIAPSGKHKLTFGGIPRNHSVIVKSKYFNERDFIEESSDHTHILSDHILKDLRQRIAIQLEYILLKIYNKNINSISKEYLNFLNVTQDQITHSVYESLLLPFIQKFGNKKIAGEVKSIIARLVETLASESPDSFIRNMETILSLSEEESRKVQYIQENYGVIKAITEKEKLIKRIDFLNTFDKLVNGDKRGLVKERSQLQQVIDKNLWLISEDFEDVALSDIYSDQALKTILEQDGMYQYDSDKLYEISLEQNIKKIPDIYIPIKKENIIYIVEIKKPTVSISQKIINDVMIKYVKTLDSINKKYNKSNERKIYGIAISDTKTGSVISMGDIDTEGIKVIAKSWSELIEETRKRYMAKIDDLDKKVKNSHWETLEDFILSHGGKI